MRGECYFLPAPEKLLINNVWSVINAVRNQLRAEKMTQKMRENDRSTSCLELFYFIFSN